jgi:anti-sigma B factor antagonist
MDKPGILALAQQPLRDHPDAILIALDGSIDPKTMNLFKDPVQVLLNGGKTRFFFDCTRLTYINSSGLAYLLNIVGTVKPKGGSVSLVGVDSKILVIFKMMGITELFQFRPTFQDALRELDEKLARELADVGPALKLEDPPKAAPAPRPSPTPRPSATPPPTRRSASQTDRMTRKIRSATPPPSGNPIAQFFRWLFGGSPGRTRSFSPMKKWRR